MKCSTLVLELRRSLRWRLTLLQCGVILTMVPIIALVAFMHAFQMEVHKQDEELLQFNKLLNYLPVHANPPPSIVLNASSKDERIWIAIFDQVDQVQESTIPVENDGFYDIRHDQKMWRAYVSRLANGKYGLVGQSEHLRQQNAVNSALSSLYLYLAISLGMVAFIFLSVKKMFRPLAQLAIDIEHQPEAELEIIRTQHVPSEVQPYLNAINHLVQQIRSDLEAQKIISAKLAHELRSPLTALQLQTDNLLRISMEPSIGRRFMALKQGVDRLQNVVEKMLALSKSRFHQQQEQPPCSVDDVLKEILSDMMPLFDGKKQHFSVEHTPQLSLPLDSWQLTTVINNLLENACKYAPHQGMILLELHLNPLSQALRIAVHDSGQGVDESEIGLLCEPFYRAKQHHNQYQQAAQMGSGLGLSIVKNIVEHTHGTMLVKNNGRLGGLSVSLELPGSAA